VTLAGAPTDGVLETYTVVQGRNGPSHAIIFGRTNDDERFIATSHDQDVLERLSQERSPIGAALRVTQAAEVNTFKFV
jgi:acetyl-CoA C-acetyltransferase